MSEPYGPWRNVSEQRAPLRQHAETGRTQIADADYLNQLEHALTEANARATEAEHVLHRLAAILDIDFGKVTIGQLGWAIGGSISLMDVAFKTNQERQAHLAAATRDRDAYKAALKDAAALEAAIPMELHTHGMHRLFGNIRALLAPPEAQA